jgi:hypothetical protein
MASESKPRGKAFAIGVALLIGCAAAFALWQHARWRQRERALEGGSVSDGTADPMAGYRRLCDAKELAGKGQYAAALPAFEEIVRTETNPFYKWDADTQAAGAMAHLGRQDDAFARLDRIMRDCPSKDQVLNAELIKGELLGLAGRSEAAISLLEKMVVENTGIRPRFCEEAIVAQAAIYRRLGQPGLVRAAFARLITDYPGSEDSRRIWAEKQTGILTETEGKSQEPRVAELVAAKRVKPVDQPGPGTTTLTAAGGPYLIAGLLQIGRDQVLQVEAGAEVRFGVLGRLSVEGRLEVLGTKDRPVLLLPLSDDPAKDWWQGVEVRQGGASQNPCRLSHCRVLGAEIGLEVHKGSVEMDHCEVARCGRASVVAGKGSRLTMASCEIVGGHRIGLEAQPASRLQMDNCRVANMTTHGLSLQELAEGSRLRQCRIENCGWAGLLIRGRCAPTIEGCVVQGAGDSAIDALEGASPIILNTSVEKNGGIGVRLRERADAVIRDSRVAGNGKAGIVAEARCAGEIVGSRVEGNGDGGVCLRLGCTTRVEHNLFIRNKGVGVLVQNSQPAGLRDNQFSGNSDAALRNEGPNAIHAASNWWGTTTEAEIAGMIQGRKDNPAWGEVEFRPWLSEPPVTTKPAS